MGTQTIGKIFRLVVVVLAFAACSSHNPLPVDKLSYVGHWESEGMKMWIVKDGTFNYRKLDGGSTTQINAVVKEFEGDNIVVGYGFITTTFVVSKPPREVDGKWKMTVDGVELTKVQ